MTALLGGLVRVGAVLGNSVCYCLSTKGVAAARAQAQGRRGWQWLGRGRGDRGLDGEGESEGIKSNTFLRIERLHSPYVYSPRRLNPLAT